MSAIRLMSTCFALLVGWVLLPGSQAMAQDWATYRLRDVRFEAPAHWALKSRIRNSLYTLESPDGDFVLSVSWWFPDEPLLGFSDIIAHKMTLLGGEPALWIHISQSGRDTFTLASEKTRHNGKKLLVSLDFPTGKAREATSVFRMITSTFSYGGGKSAENPQPTGAMPNPTEKSPPIAAIAPGRLMQDPEGHFSVAVPRDWQYNTANRNGTRIVALLPPDRSAIALILSRQLPAGGQTEDLFREYEEVFHSDSFVTESIDGDRDDTVRGIPARFLDLYGEVYAVEGVKLPFSRGRLHKYLFSRGAYGYAIYLIFPEDVSVGVRGAFRGLLDSFTAEQDGSNHSVVAPKPPNPSGIAQANVAPIPASLSARFGGDCEAVNPARWAHPTLPVFKRHGNNHVQAVYLCRGRSHPVFETWFHYDPQGQTSDYFLPLYLDILDANQGGPFSLWLRESGLLIDVRKNARDEIDVRYTDINPTGAYSPIAVSSGRDPETSTQNDPFGDVDFNLFEQ